MQKQMLFFVNPNAGHAEIRTQLMDVVTIFTRGGYDVTVHPTSRSGEIPQVIAAEGHRYDMIVSAGGDGTLNESVAGLMQLSQPPVLGYLPGGDHTLATKPATTLPALEKALALLKTGGLLSLMIYSGGDSGFEEKEQVLAWLKGLDPERYMVLIESFYNRPNNPPLPVFIKKML